MKTKQKKQNPKIEEMIIQISASNFDAGTGRNVIGMRWARLSELSESGIDRTRLKVATELFQKAFLEMMNDLKK